MRDPNGSLRFKLTISSSFNLRGSLSFDPPARLSEFKPVSPSWFLPVHPSFSLTLSPSMSLSLSLPMSQSVSHLEGTRNFLSYNPSIYLPISLPRSRLIGPSALKNPLNRPKLTMKSILQDDRLAYKGTLPAPAETSLHIPINNILAIIVRNKLTSQKKR